MSDESCGHCGHGLPEHAGKQCECGCYWPFGPPPPTPNPSEEDSCDSGLSGALYDAFWAAADATFNDDTVHSMDMPYFDQDMDTVDGHLPRQFWKHMAEYFSDHASIESIY